MAVNKSFLEKIEKNLEKRKKIEFFILIWGSGKSDKIAFKKREKMAKELSKEFNKDDIIMSEARELQPITKRLGDSVSESLQVDAADFVIILDTSIGPHLEAHEYFYKISNKSVFISSSKHAKSKSFPSNIRYKYNITWYKDEEYHKCKLIDAVSEEDIFQHCKKKALILREKKFNHMQNVL